MGTALGYIRRSRIDMGRVGAVSHEEQSKAVRALAAAHGYELRDTDILEDWGRSGGAGKEGQRAAYVDLRARVEAGAVTDIFAYNLARLTRSGVEWASLAEACTAHGVRVHFPDQSFDFRGINGRMIASILAAVAQAERERAQEAGLVTIGHRRARGDTLGPPKYGTAAGEDAAAVVAAFREAGSYHGAARLLNERGVTPKTAGMTPSGRMLSTATPRPYLRASADMAPRWRGGTVRRIVTREAPQLVPRNSRAGSRTVQSWRFAGLLRCHCGGLLTGGRRPHDIVAYRCSAGPADPSHGSPMYVPESAILPWMKAEMARVRHDPAYLRAEDAAAERADLAARLDRANDLLIAGRITRERYDREAAAVDGELDKLAAFESVVDVPAIDWDWPAADVNRLIRILIDHVQLGPDLRPVSATWRNPELRS